MSEHIKAFSVIPLQKINQIENLNNLISYETRLTNSIHFFLFCLYN